MSGKLTITIHAADETEALGKLAEEVDDPARWQAGPCERGEGVDGLDRFYFHSPPDYTVPD